LIELVGSRDGYMLRIPFRYRRFGIDVAETIIIGKEKR